MKKLIIGTDTLKPALKKLSQVIVKNAALPALSNIYLKARMDEVELICSDLELTISYICPCECLQEFEALIPFEFLQKVIGLSDSQPWTIEVSGGKGILKGKYDVYQLGKLEKVEAFPKIPDIPKKNMLVLDGKFMEWLGRSMSSVGKDDSRPAMMKALLEFGTDGITIVTTDAHCIFKHFFPMAVPGPEQILISPKIARALQDFEKTTLFWHAKHVALKADNVTLIATRHNDKYPDYKVVIPNHGPNLEVYRSELIGALHKTALVSSQLVRFRFPVAKNKRFNIQATDTDLGRDSDISIAGDYSGTTEEISFSPVLFLTLLHQIPFDEIRLHIDTARRGVLISAEEDPDYLGMIMPLS
jgi:DNA polymerase-3 subunit beta